ncbi:hypothetical protein D0Z00_004180 [Geotrichum galactomycetum]|uniref:Uncharacterized protein n=1 Tax=Geotrichum galactomycetum TaxID=27317 RepID=A0ACB6UZ62_9ASCO|nr:hypothetical protein D0Z00_004180 [Geotrichum candidum]
MSSSSDVLYRIQNILEKIDDIDQDIRFMSFNDLNTFLSDPEFITVFRTQASLTTKVANGIVMRLNDNISEVQNQAIKCQYLSLIQFIQSEFNIKKSDYNAVKNLSLLCGTVAKADPSKFKIFLQDLLPIIIDTLQMNLIGEEEDESSELLEIRDASLSTLEILSEFDHNSVEPFIKDLLDVCKTFLVYDPNFEDDEGDIFDNEGDVKMEDKNEEDDENDFDFGGDDDDEYDIDDAAFSDDDDQSWKMRRHAAILASNIAQNLSGSLPSIYEEILRLVIVRVTKEREENVKVVNIEALDQLIGASGSDKYFYSTKVNYSHKRKSSDVSMFAFPDPKEVLNEVLSVVVKYIVSDINSKSTSVATKHAYISVLKTYINVVEGFPVEDLSKVVGTISELSEVPSSPFLKDLLELVSATLKKHKVAVLTPHIPILTQVIISGINDTYYRTSLEGLDASRNLFPLFKESKEISGSDLKDVFINKISQSSFDIETRKKAIHALGSLIAVGHLPVDDANQSADSIREQLANELLRVDALQAIVTFVSVSESANSFSTEWLFETAANIAAFLKQKSITVRSETLNTLHALVKIISSRSGSQVSNELGSIVKTLLGHVNSILSPSAAEVPLVGTVVQIFSETLGVVDNSISSQIIEFGKFVLTQDYATKIQSSVLDLFDKITCLQMTSNIFDTLSQLSFTSDSLVPAAVAITIVNCKLFEKVDILLQTITSGSIPTDIERALHILGNVGKRTPLSIPLEGIYNNFESSVDNVRSAAALALGDIIIGNTDHYLPDLLKRLTSSESNKNVYLYLFALRDIVYHLQKNHESHVSRSLLDQVWETLFSLKFKDDMSEEGEKTLVAECIGRLSIIDPEKYLPALQENLNSPEASVRRSVVSGVKYTFGLSLDKYDRLLRPIVVDFLALMEDSNLGIRQVALSALTSAIHNKPLLLLPHLSRLLPLLYKETVVNESLIRVVQMGPFKHKVDDGLDLRKAAYESMFTLATTLPREWQLNLFKDDQFIERILVGLDDEQDIKVLSCVTIARIISVDVRVLLSKRLSTGATTLEELIKKFTAILSVQLKDTALKQEVENQVELERNVVRASLQIEEAIKEATSVSDLEFSGWAEFMKSPGIVSAYK